MDAGPGTFVRTTAGSTRTLGVATATMTLFSPVPMDGDALKLDITVATDPVEVPDPDWPDDPPYLLHHDLTTQWLAIRTGDLVSRDEGALDGFSLDWTDDGGHPPAAIYDDRYGMVSRFALSLTHLGGNRYRLAASGQSEFDEAFALNCTAALLRVTLRPTGGTPGAEAEAALARLFDHPGAWHSRGSPAHPWRDLVLSFEGSPS